MAEDGNKVADEPMAIPIKRNSITERAAELRGEAMQAIKQARDDLHKNEAQHDRIERQLTDAIVAAVDLGIRRPEIAGELGVSVTSVSNVLRSEHTEGR